MLILLMIVHQVQITAQSDSICFETALEEKLFAAIADSAEIEYLEMFLAIDSDEIQLIEERVNKFEQELLTATSRRRNLKRVLKTVYEEVHDEFFTKYTEQVHFSEIFETGHYNCVSATALYAMILDELGIEYIIKETPTHVYLIADPTETSYLFESTLPATGAIQFNYKYQKAFVDYLHDNKVISDEEFRKYDTNWLFMEYYSKDVTIDIRELAAIQYYNDGVFEANEENFREAYCSLAKARVLYPSNTINYMLNFAVSNLLDQEYNTSDPNPEHLSDYLELNRKSDASMQRGINYFNDISIKMVVERSAVEQYKLFYSRLDMENIDSLYQGKLTEVYNSVLSYYHYLKGEYRPALNYIEGAYQVNPNDIETQQMVKELTAKVLMDMEENEEMLDSLNRITKRFPFLYEDKEIGSIRIWGLCYLISNCYLDSDFQKGKRYIEQLEMFARTDPDMGMAESNIEAAFAQASAAYVQEEEYRMAEDVLKRGLKLLPNSIVLKNRLRTVSDFNDSFGSARNSARALKIYNQALGKAKRSAGTIVRNFYKHGMRKWSSYRIIDGADIYDVESDQEFDFELKLNRRAKLMIFGIQMNGRWVFNEDNCTLTIHMDNNEERVSILITEISSNTISGVVFTDGDHSNAYKIFLKAS